LRIEHSLTAGLAGLIHDESCAAFASTAECAVGAEYHELLLRRWYPLPAEWTADSIGFFHAFKSTTHIDLTV
jgi:hypothetical protein